jgi:hypothetical protein
MSPTRIVVDCSAARQPDPVIVGQLRNEAIALLEAGKAAEAANVMQQAREHAEAALHAEVTSRDYTEEELAQHDLDQAAAAAHAAAADEAAAERAKLVAKLTAGKATSAEVQQALAQLLA